MTKKELAYMLGGAKRFCKQDEPRRAELARRLIADLKSGRSKYEVLADSVKFKVLEIEIRI